LEDVIPAVKQAKKKKTSSSTWVLYRNSFNCILKTSISKFEWVRNPFVATDVSGLTTCEHEQLTDMSCDGSFKDVFDADKLS